MAPFLSFLAAFGIAFLLTAFLRAFLNRRKASPEFVSPFGGLAIVGSFFGVFSFLPFSIPTGVWVGAFALTLVGFFDDLRPFSPGWKLGLTVLGAVLATGLGLSMKLVGSPLLDGILTVVWLVWMCHAFNVLDMEDGLSAGCGTIAGLGLGLMGLMGKMPVLFSVGLVLTGGLAGFWVHNRYPARIYMGDTGSLFAGFLLGAMGVGLSRSGGPWGFAGAFLVLGVFSFEAVFISTARFAKGRPAWKASRDHVAQRLIEGGKTVWGAVIRIYGAGVLLAFSGIAVVYFQWPGGGLIFAGAVLGAIWIGHRLLKVDMEGDGVDGRQAGLLSKNWTVHRLMRQKMEELSCRVGGRLLDIGCGNRPFELLFKGRLSAYVGMELDRERYRESRIDVWGDALALPFERAGFETVLCNQVLEHVTEPERVLQEIARVLKPEGYLILTAPHIWGVHEEPHDYFRFTPYGLQHLAEKAGLEVEGVSALAGYWVTAGVRFCYYLEHFDRGVLTPFVRLAYFGVQCCALVLDRIHRVEGDAWNFLMVARRPV